MIDRIRFEIVEGTKGRDDLALLKLRGLEIKEDGWSYIPLTMKEARFLHRGLDRYIISRDDAREDPPNKTS